MNICRYSKIAPMTLGDVDNLVETVVSVLPFDGDA